jgi:hypothetical protein
MTTAALKISYLDPIILYEEGYLFRPGHIDLEVRKKGSGIRLSLFLFMMIHENAPFSMMV